MLYRAWFRHSSGARSPMCDPGNRFPAGKRTSSKANSLVTDARSENLFLISGAVKPFIPFSTRKPATLPSSLAHTTATSAMLPLVIHIFEPLRM